MAVRFGSLSLAETAALLHFATPPRCFIRRPHQTLSLKFMASSCGKQMRQTWMLFTVLAEVGSCALVSLPVYPVWSVSHAAHLLAGGTVSAALGYVV